jgi:hypothetical protein
MAPESNVPAVSLTLPLGVDPPEKPATVTVTLSAWPVPMVGEAGATVTVGVATVTETGALPVDALYLPELAVSGV